jgi:glucosamine--fructose-6-phosphate aminotransferase (isomerizing)
MCGIFGSAALEAGAILPTFKHFSRAGKLSERRGKDASGFALGGERGNHIFKHPSRFRQMLRANRSSIGAVRSVAGKSLTIQIGHTRMVTHGSRQEPENNQPICQGGVVLYHNGIILNSEEILSARKNYSRQGESDTEALLSLYLEGRGKLVEPETAFLNASLACEGGNTFVLFDSSCAFLGLSTTTGSIYTLEERGVIHFASEPRVLATLAKSYAVPNQILPGEVRTFRTFQNSLSSSWTINSALGDSDSKQVGAVHSKVKFEDFEFNWQSLLTQKRCTICVLPLSHPGIVFDEQGVCSLCRIPTGEIAPRKGQLQEFREMLERATPESPILVPFSGGRDSTYMLGVLARDWSLPVLAFTYDWGFVTDRARRNISRVCGELGVEHLLVAADIDMKRKNVSKNLRAWMKSPDLGLIPLLMAGDKHFFSIAETLRRERNCHAVVFGMNRLEHTRFKAGLAGVRGSEGARRVIHDLGGFDKIRMVLYYIKAFLRNVEYINTSIVDTALGFLSYYARKVDYENFFDYVEWSEEETNRYISEEFAWESSNESKNTWRVGDATAAFYNYVYQHALGFNEFDTFRSNQVRSGQITREKAMQLLETDVAPRVSDFNDYASTVGTDPLELLDAIHKTPRYLNA